ncbi:MAG: TonB-dependent receptor [Muribaculaceae bacterium]|nr:TonB-dependent receptor [Muribaculaceae bacterium]
MRKFISVIAAFIFAASAIAATGVKGRLKSSETGAPVADANILLRDQGLFTVSSADGYFSFESCAPGKDMLQIVAFGFEDLYVDIDLKEGATADLGVISLTQSADDNYLMTSDEFIFDEEQVMEDEGLSQNVGTIQGATDDIFYQMSNYNFSAVYYKARGLNSDWQTTYVNGIRFNDPLRGQFSFSSLGGMTSTAFRQRTTTLGSDAAAYGYGSIGGSSNVTTYASEYAPGFRGSVAYTNSNYMLRALFQYNSGLNKNGWAFSASVIGRYADQGVIAGTFYNSVGYSLSLQKVFNSHHSLNLSTWGAPTQRATAKATTKEAYELAGSNLYNPSWGWLNGKKISSRITETFDPTVTLNWIWKPKDGTTLNTGFAFRHNGYVRSDVTWYNTYDPRPDYYRNFPSYYAPTAEPGTTLYDTQMAQYDYMTDMWRNDESWRQINFDQMYQTNLLNRNQFDRDPDLKGQSSYMLYNKHSNFTFWSLNSTLSHRLNNMMSLQGGVSFNYTDGHYYKTVRDLLGGLFWRDVDSFSERDFAGNQDILQNDLNNPNRKVTEGEVFGYDYNIRNYLGHIWAQNQINTRHWNLFYAVEADFTSFQRIGHMRNGRAPEDSYGKGKSHSFVTGAGKIGVTYKLDGRNYFTLHAAGGNRAPFATNSYVNLEVKDEAVRNLDTEKYFSGDISYTWVYPRFRGSITGYFTHIWDANRHSFFWDYDANSMMSYTLTGLQTEQKGIELGLEYKIWGDLSIQGAANVSLSQYKNNPMGIRSYTNGAYEDIERRTYLKNYRIGCTPQQAYSIALKYNINRWFFEVNGNLLLDNYVDISYTRHEEMPGLWKFCTSAQEYEARRAEILYQDKLNNAFVMNLSIGKMYYTKFGSLNFNLSVNNLLNNRNIQMSGYQEQKFDYTNYNVGKFPNKYTYAQGIRVFFNVGIRF